MKPERARKVANWLEAIGIHRVAGMLGRSAGHGSVPRTITQEGCANLWRASGALRDYVRGAPNRVAKELLQRGRRAVFQGVDRLAVARGVTLRLGVVSQIKP